MFQRRLPLNRWPHKRLVEHIRAVYLRDMDDPHRIAVVLHQDHRLLSRKAIREAADRGKREIGEGDLAHYIVFRFKVNEENQTYFALGEGPSAFADSSTAWDKLGEADDDARGWTGRDAERVEFEQLPNMFRVAFFETVTGERSEPDMSWFM